jgi:hypothetical protein
LGGCQAKYRTEARIKSAALPAEPQPQRKACNLNFLHLCQESGLAVWQENNNARLGAILSVGKHHTNPSNCPASSRFWGDLGRHSARGLEPTVQAYPWALAKEQRGIEFTTSIKPYPMSSPFEARWYLTLTPGVMLRQKNGKDYACITATVDNRQP